MNRINILLLFTTLSLIASCSSDDINKDNKWVVKLVVDCENSCCRTPHCVTEAEYDRLDNLTGPCKIITLTDIFGETHLGVPVGFSFSIHGQNCN